MSQAFQYLHFQDRSLIPKGFSILSPLSGPIENIESHDDPLFHAGIMGPGVSFHITGHSLHAPFDGTVTQRSPDGNQLLLTATNGLQLHLHFIGDAQCLRIPTDIPALYNGRNFKKGEFLSYIETRRLQRQNANQHCVVSVFNAEHFGKVYCGARRFTAAEDSLFTVTPRPQPAV